MLNRNKKTKRLHTVRSHFPKLNQKNAIFRIMTGTKMVPGTGIAMGRERPVIEVKKRKHQCSHGHATCAHASHSNIAIRRPPMPNRKAGSH